MLWRSSSNDFSANEPDPDDIIEPTDDKTWLVFVLIAAGVLLLNWLLGLVFAAHETSKAWRV